MQIKCLSFQIILFLNASKLTNVTQIYIIEYGVQLFVFNLSKKNQIQPDCLQQKFAI